MAHPFFTTTVSSIFDSALVAYSSILQLFSSLKVTRSIKSSPLNSLTLLFCFEFIVLSYFIFQWFFISIFFRYHFFYLFFSIINFIKRSTRLIFKSVIEQLHKHELIKFRMNPKNEHKHTHKNKPKTQKSKNEQLFEQDIGPLKRSLSAKSRRFSRISDLALVTNCFWAKTCHKKRVNVSYNCYCVCYVFLYLS